MTIQSAFKWAAAIICSLLIIVVLSCTWYRTDDTEWQAIQYVGGELEIRDTPGTYFAFFPKVTDYPRNSTYEFSSKNPNVKDDTDDSIRVTFNDGGTAQISAVLRVTTPTTAAQKREFHRQFNGSEKNIEAAIWAHLSNVIKATGPIMSASENQAARKSEFNALVLEQMNSGLYEMRRTTVELDQLDEKGNKMRVAATEVMRDPKTAKPIISQRSPLEQYGILVTQLSITETEYDAQTRTQFETKKAAFLKAESAKAEREGEVQQRLMIEEKGKRELAETTAAANLVKEQATIEAMKEKEVAETEAAKKLAVATKTKETAEMEAQQKLEVAKLSRQAAEEEAKQIVLLAQAEKDKIALAGAITEKEKVTLEVQQKTAIGVAEALAQLKTPQVVITGGKEGQQGGNQSDLINLWLLKQNGLLDTLKTPAAIPAR